MLPLPKLKPRTNERDPENMCPYGPQNHPLPEPKNKSMGSEELSDALGMSGYLNKNDQKKGN